MEDKGVRVHQLPEPFRGEVVAYIGKAEAAGNAGGTRHSGKDNCLGYAITVASPYDDARLERLSFFQIDPVWVIPDFVPDGIKQSDAFLEWGLSVDHSISGEGYDLRCVTVNIVSGPKVLFEIISHISLTGVPLIRQEYMRKGNGLSMTSEYGIKRQ